MNKIKLAFISIAILAAVGGAFATNSCFTCGYSDQYVWTGSHYQLLTGEYQEDYDCYMNAGVCTYYRPEPYLQPNNYAPCHEGLYTPL